MLRRWQSILSTFLFRITDQLIETVETVASGTANVL